MAEKAFAKSGRAVAPRPPMPDGKAVSLKPPARSTRRGVSLVELMISMLILAIVCLAWLQIIGIQSARKEARRREAVERLAGMMDAFLYTYKTNGKVKTGNYRMEAETSGSGVLEFRKDSDDSIVHPVFADGVSPVGYRLTVVKKDQLPDQARFGTGWTTASPLNDLWLVGRLYNGNGVVSDLDRAFFTLSVCLGL